MPGRSPWLALCLLAVCLPVAGADLPAARLIVKPLLCVTEREADACSMTFDIRWKSQIAAEYCLNDSALTAPLRCWAKALCTVAGRPL